MRLWLLDSQHEPGVRPPRDASRRSTRLPPSATHWVGRREAAAAKARALSREGTRLSGPQLRIEGVAQRVAEEVEPEDREADRDARGDREPRGLVEEGHALAPEHQAP